MTNRLLPIFVASFFLSSGCWAIEKVASYDHMEIGGAFPDTTHVTASITLESPACDKNGASLPEIWGVDGYCPRKVASELKVTIQSTAIQIPKSAYSDLAYVNLTSGFYFKQAGNVVKLYLLGGDGVAAYTAMFSFSSGKLVSRVIEYLDRNENTVRNVKNF